MTKTSFPAYVDYLPLQQTDSDLNNSLEKKTKDDQLETMSQNCRLFDGSQ